MGVDKSVIMDMRLEDVDSVEKFDRSLSMEGCIKLYNRHFEQVIKKRKELFDLRKSLPRHAEFFRGQHVFITGGSGFLGRVLLEKILSTAPGVSKVSLLLRPKKGVEAHDRVRVLTDDPLFEQLKREQPDALSKVVAVPGDCAELGLSLSDADRKTLEQSVTIVFHCAASVRFNDPVRKAVLLNMRGTREVVELCKKAKNLKALVHVSTAYCNTDVEVTEDRIYPTPLDWKVVIRAAETNEQVGDRSALDNLGHLLLGYQPNTYTWTKALAEQIMNDAYYDGLPAFIVRPSIGTIYPPVPGWIDNLNGFGGFGAGISMGVIRVALTPKNLPRDLQPVDICVMCILEACRVCGLRIKGISKHEGVPVTNAVGGEVKWETTERLIMYAKMNRDMTPCAGAIRYPFMWNTQCPFTYRVVFFFQHFLFGVFIDTLLHLSGNKPMLLPVYRKMVEAVSALQYFNTPRSFNFSLANAKRMRVLVHPDDEELFDVPFEKLVMNKYKEVGHTQIKGMCEYALKKKPDYENSKKHLNRLFWAEIAWYVFLVGLAVWWFW